MSSGSESDRSATPAPSLLNSRPQAPRATQPATRGHLPTARTRLQPYTPPLRGSAATADAPREVQRSARLNGAVTGATSVPTPTATGGRRARTWPLSVVPFEVSEDVVDEEYFEQLARTFDLRAPYDFFAEELVQMPISRQYHVLVYSILSVRQAVDAALRMQEAPRETAPAQNSISVQARLYQYQRSFRTFVQNRAKEVLMDPELEVYSCDPVRGGPPAGRSSLDQVLDHVRAQSDEFLQDYLPRGFLTHEPAAEASVNSELRDRLKHERGTMRNLLLTNVHDPSGRPITRPVPSLTNLIIEMRQRMSAPTDQTATETLTPRLPIGRRLRARIAYLRIQTISHYARRAPGDVNRQWALIDEQLQDLRGRSSDYRRAFFKLIMELDDALFGDQFFSELNPELIRPPSEAEVLAKMEAIQQEATRDATVIDANQER